MLWIVLFVVLYFVLRWLYKMVKKVAQEERAKMIVFPMKNEADGLVSFDTAYGLRRELPGGTVTIEGKDVTFVTDEHETFHFNGHKDFDSFYEAKAAKEDFPELARWYIELGMEGDRIMLLYGLRLITRYFDKTSRMESRYNSAKVKMMLKGEIPIEGEFIED